MNAIVFSASLVSLPLVVSLGIVGFACWAALQGGARRIALGVLLAAILAFGLGDVPIRCEVYWLGLCWF